MASICPRCHQELEEDAVCCAELRHTWKCRQCQKRSTGFVVPRGRCFLCGGENEIVEPYAAPDPQAARTVEEALQFEVDMYQFYRLGRERAADALQKAVFEQLYLKEQDHLAEIETKYHVHLDPQVLEPPVNAERLLAAQLFQGIDLVDPAGSVRPLYEKALAMEERTRDHFARRAREMPPGAEREIFRELAAEEEEHVAILETELAYFNAMCGSE